MMKTNEIYNVKITDMSNLGYGICRIDGKVVFVSGAVDGDECSVKITKAGRDFSQGEAVEISAPSPHRKSSDCDVCGKCGGCNYRNISYAHELELKKRYIEGIFRKNKLDIPVSDVVNDGNTDHWRSKVIYSVGNNGEMGFNAQKSHDIVPNRICLLESQNIAPISAFLRTYFAEKGNCGVKNVCIRSGDASGEVMVCFVTQNDTFDVSNELVDELTSRFTSIVSIIHNVKADSDGLSFGEKSRILYGKDCISDILCGLRFDISLNSFYQINHSMTERLYRHASALADMKSGEKLVDLFCGIGTIGLHFADRFPKIELSGIEIVPSAVENAKANALVNGIENARFICGDATSSALDRADVVVVDPPRRGLTAALIERICASSPSRVIYISCGPDTLARDLVVFKNYGYTADCVTPFDLFPRTGHCECCVMLTK